MLCFAANASIARVLPTDGGPVPTNVRLYIIKDSGESFIDSVLMVKGNTFAPGARTGKYLEHS